MSYGAVPPPSDLNAPSNSGARPNSMQKRFEQQKQQQYVSLTQGYSKPPQYGTDHNSSSSRKRICDDDYFEDDSDDDDKSYKKRSSKSDRSSSAKNDSLSPKKKENDNSDNEDDPLDSFMAEIDAQAKEDKSKAEKKQETVAENPGTSVALDGGQQGRDDIDQEDMQESYFNFLEDYKAKQEDEDEVYEYDDDGNIIWTWKKVIDPLPKIDHSTIKYKPFKKDIYFEHEDIKNANARDIFDLRSKIEVRVYGSNPPKPVTSFGHFSFDEMIMRQLRQSEFERPTPIQSQAIPVALKGRDMLGLAKTGSGKTLAYLLPAICHIMEQEELSLGEGPIVLVIVPTRELAIQVYQQSKSYCRPFNINVVCAYGGGNKHEQKRALEEGAELVICTPGRIIDLVKSGATNFLRTTFLVFDEVDRMFDLGFEPQVKSIADQIRPDRQCLMFSATMKKKVEKLAVHALEDPVKIICGDVGEVNSDVEQTICVLASLQAKWDWLFSHIVQFCTMGKLLIFVTKIADAEDVAKKLKLRDIRDLVLLHGDMLQHERNEQISSFRGSVSVMVATDVAARGLDIPQIRNVVNFDVARDLDTHVHRVGRTGRAGQRGFAHTLVTEADKEFCGHLVKNLESIGQQVPADLMSLALKSTWFKRQHNQQQVMGCGSGSVAGVNKQRLGFGYKPKVRPGFGETSVTDSHLSFFTSQSSGPSVSKVLEKAKNFVNSGNDSGDLSKGQMMRSALKNTFQNTFQKSTTSEWEVTRQAASDPTPEWKKQLEQRVASINQTIQLHESQKEKTDTQVDQEPPRRASRWQK